MMARDFPVDEEVLELLPAGEPQRPEPVARTPVSNRQRARTDVTANDGHRRVAGRGQKVRPNPSRCRLGRNDAPGFRQPNLSWNSQRIVENVRAGPITGLTC